MMAVTVKEILIALYEGLARFGLGQAGIAWPEEPKETDNPKHQTPLGSVTAVWAATARMQ